MLVIGSLKAFLMFPSAVGRRAASNALIDSKAIISQADTSMTASNISKRNQGLSTVQGCGWVKPRLNGSFEAIARKSLVPPAVAEEPQIRFPKPMRMS